MMVNITTQFELRAAGPADQQFRRRLFAASRAGVLEMTGLGTAQVEALLDMQFTARERQYGEQFPSCEDLLILVDGQAAGSFSVDRRPDAIRLVDIALLPDYQGAGIGTALLSGLQREAALANTPVVLQVATGNPAARLYRRLGFVLESGDGVYDLMRWQPPPAGAGRER